MQIAGEFVKAGAAAPDFELVKTDLSTLSLKDLRGKQVILNIFRASIRAFAPRRCVSSTNSRRSCRERSCWPFRKTCLSLMRVLHGRGNRECRSRVGFPETSFDESYGVLMTDGPLKGLLARSVVVIDGDGKVVYTELVPEITQEPDYDKALAAVKR